MASSHVLNHLCQSGASVGTVRARSPIWSCPSQAPSHKSILCAAQDGVVAEGVAHGEEADHAVDGA